MKGPLTIVMMYFETPIMLEKQLDYWCNYPSKVNNFLRVVLVDDGSPDYPAFEVLKHHELPEFPLHLYRAKENIIYNHSGGFNLAYTKVEDGWTLMTDMDHVIPYKSISRLMSKELNPDSVYRFNRKRMVNENEFVTHKRHLDSILLTKAMYWRVGGFNEDFRGYWNGVSYLFRKKLKHIAKIEFLSDIYSLFFPNTVVSDSENTKYGKQYSEYDIHQDPIMERKLRKALLKLKKPENIIRFEWEQMI